MKKSIFLTAAIGLIGSLVLSGCGSQGVADMLMRNFFSGAIDALAMPSMDGTDSKLYGEDDRPRAEQARQQAFNGPLKETVTWFNPNNGHWGAVVPIEEYYQDKKLCRSFEVTVSNTQGTQQGKESSCG